MPYCEKCLTEYVAGVRICEDCGVPLVAGSPPEIDASESEREGAGKAIAGMLRSLLGVGSSTKRASAKIVRVRVFSGPTAGLEAELARNLLRARGIPSTLPGEASAEMLPVLDIPLLVLEKDARRARAILRNYFDRPSPEVPR
jgi:Putative prokaryotic signal transducing protein